VHRIGRTGRAGHEGKAITFVTSQEEHLLRDIKEFAGTGVAPAEVPEAKGKEQVRKVWDFDETANIFGMVRFDIKLGRIDGVTVVDIADLISHRAKVNEMMIGNIIIEDAHSVVEVHKDVALRVLNSLRGIDYRGKKVGIEPFQVR
jgi:ATP-dependent RNA helicase DeaD